jgi:hypothetical protein
MIGGGAAGSPELQVNRTRFGIVAPTDTTFEVALGQIRWVRRGQTGIVVDPRRDFELVAEFTVTRVSDSTAYALVTGMRTGLTTYHIALLREPVRSWLKQRIFWIGGAAGLVAGYFIGRG